MIGRTKTVIASLLTCAALAIAHGGFDHVGGTVLKLESSVLTVKTTHGNVAIRLDAKTEITQNGKPAQVADLKPGVKVVVDVPEETKEKIAHSIRIGTAAKATTDTHEHDAHK